MLEEIVRRLSVDHVRFAYRLLRHSAPVTEPVIVIGGGLQGMLGWPSMDDRIAPVTSLITADLPGMGDADPLPAELGTELLCAAIDRILDDLGEPRVNLFGFSYGAELVFRCAQRRPQLVARLALGGAVPHTTAAQRDQVRRAGDHLAAGRIAEFATAAAEAQLCLDEEHYIPRRDLVYRYVRRSMLHAATTTPNLMDYLQRALLSGQSFTGGLSGVPTLVFTGEHDTISSPARQRAFAATVPGSRFRTIKDADHWVVLERAGDVADLALRFFTDRPLDTATYLTGHVTTSPGP
ncbi:alpha/beta hydrolase [Amycolatopsis sp. QT-25]|uniref:alpha/beta fold hydrolase n=1 Tax=Amycolatopsis sp. QT-25 TaxID=3034022 RepID=UPI0023EDCCA7|nr:alpha/beta hydrolase [Amycolatopsis sp. QT-25]WET76249.1 alpha/beta hydrolase [Amycolatopsis sp. QT-25]